MNIPVVEMSEDGHPHDEDEIPDEAYHMVSQVNWEDDVVWSGEDIKHKVSCKASYCVSLIFHPYPPLSSLS